MGSPNELFRVPADGRFEISNDPYSQARFAALVETTRYMQTRIPSFITNILFGSLSKGKHLSKSVLSSTDIDICAFYDASKSAFDYSTPDRIKKLLQDGMNEKLKYTEDIPIVNTKVYPLDKKGYFGILDRLFQLRYEEEDIINMYYLEIASFFGYDVTGKLQPYREGFFQEVEEKIPPEKHNALWGSILQIIKIVERGDREEHGPTRQYNIPSNMMVFYPSTYKDAKMMYGIPS